ncbi:MAG: methyl-accepting chemotaxis protein [Phycisphaerales bacterium]
MQAVMDTPDTVKPASDRNMIEEARRVCEAASQGNLEVRILGIDPEHEMAPMLFALNHLLDMSDAFVREATASLSYAGQGKFFRRVLPEGMLGTFANAARTINETTDRMGSEAKELQNARERQAEQQKQEREAAEELAKKVDQLLHVTEAASEGDLTQEITVTGTDAIGSLATGLSSMMSAMSSVLGEVGAGAEQIDQGAGQFASASQALSDGSSRQASSLEEISASLEEMSTMIQQNAENTVQASGISKESQDAAGKGLNEMALMTEAMSQITSSSQEISKIIKIIDEIAFQTNLLALNAAVEAARAGEAGKGFAVVAEEVRSLALRCKEAASNTSELIEESSKRAENGAAISQRVHKSLEMIAKSTNQVNTLLSEIASASQEQSQGIVQINAGVSELDSVTQQNASNAEELAAGAEQMASQVTALREMISRFRVKGCDDE